jgi:hypothetical protein
VSIERQRAAASGEKRPRAFSGSDNFALTVVTLIQWRALSARLPIQIRAYLRDIHPLSPCTISLIPFLITGEGDDYLTVSLRDGGAAVGMSLAKGRLDLHIKPARVRFDDNQWHKIIVHRKVQEVMIMFQLLYRARR